MEATNRWIGRTLSLYQPVTLVAYDLEQELSRCKATGIDLTGFGDQFCLGSAFKAQKSGGKTPSTPLPLSIVASTVLGAHVVEQHTANEDNLHIQVPLFQTVGVKRIQLIEPIAAPVESRITSDLLKAQSKTKAKQLRLNSRSLLVGDYPAKLDLVEHDLDPEILMHMGAEFVKARKQGRLPRPNVLIANNATVEIIDLTTPSFTCEYVALQNLPNLRELYVPAGTSLQWLVCVDLPKLKKIEVKSDICWLQLEDMPSLEKVDVKDCARLDHFSIKNAPLLRTVNVSSCKKLKSIRDMDLATQKSLGVKRQIKKCQQESRKDGVIYEGMTHTDIDIVLQSINEGYKIAVAKGMVEEYADDPPRADEIPQFGFSLMRPLEWVYTGGTGELYTYDAQEIQDDCVLSSMGQHTQEECLKEALTNVVSRGLRLPRNQKSTNEKVLAFFYRTVGRA